MSIDVRKCFGKSLKKIRQTAGLTQEELSNSSRLEPNTISCLEHGKTLSVESIQKLSDALELHPRAFFEPLEIDKNATDKEIRMCINEKIKNLSTRDLKILFKLACSLEEENINVPKAKNKTKK